MAKQKTSARNARLAAHGGKPVWTKPWKRGDYHFPSDAEAVRKVLAGPALPLARGRAVMAYRDALQKMYGVRYAVPTSSGTTALHVALSAAGVGAGDEVILSPLTDYGSVIGIFQLNAIPVFADVQPNGLLMDVDAAAACITRHTKAIMPVHIGGYVVDMRALMRLAKKRGIAVVEDCAQCHLAEIGNRMVGTFGDVGAWSTNESKHMKSGEGGFLLTNNKKLGQMADLFSDKCYRRFPGAPETPAFPALNVRLSDVNAALALAQLKRLPGWISRRRAFADAFLEGISDVPGVVPQPQPRGTKPSYWWVMFCVDQGVLGVDATGFSDLVRPEGIPVWSGPQPHLPDWEVFQKLHRNPNVFPAYRPGRLRKGSFDPERTPIARSSRERIVRLQMSQHNTVAEARASARAIRKVVSMLLGKKI